MDRQTRLALAFVPLLTLFLFASSTPPPKSAGRLTPVASMHAPRANHTSTLLPDGRVLIAGGMVENGVFLDSAELFDPAKGKFTPSARMNSRRVGHTATLLPDGKVLIAGGLAGRIFEGGPGVVGTTEIYDPALDRFTAGPRMTERRSGQIAVLLRNGKVLVAGGADANWHPLRTAETYDAAAHRFTMTGSMLVPRAAFAAVLLEDGRVLAAGGADNHHNPLASAEIYDPETEKWQAAGDMISPREKHAAAVLEDGRVLITGGSSDGLWHPMRTAELFDPRTGKFSAVSDMDAARFKLPNAMVTLKNGNVLVAGGAAEVEVYEPAAGKFRRAGSLDAPHYFPSATLLPDGRVLISGGYGTGAGRRNGPLSTDRAWAYQP